jgi:hypothetical protein
MRLIIKQIIVMIITFLIILWFQTSDDKKHKYKRVSLYDQYKLPVLISTIISLNFLIFFKFNECDSITNFTEISILTPIKEIEVPMQYNYKDIINNLQISTDMPDF